jgi:hypothetical protein
LAAKKAYFGRAIDSLKRRKQDVYAAKNTINWPKVQILMNGFYWLPKRFQQFVAIESVCHKADLSAKIHCENQAKLFPMAAAAKLWC